MILAGVNFLIVCLMIWCILYRRLDLCDNKYSIASILVLAMLAQLASCWLWSISNRTESRINLNLDLSTLLLNIILQSIAQLTSVNLVGIEQTFVFLVHCYYCGIWIYFIVSYVN